MVVCSSFDLIPHALGLSSIVSRAEHGGQSDYRSIIAVFVGCIPVNFTTEPIWSLLGHLLKVLVTLPLFLFGRSNVVLSCENANNVPNCARIKTIQWLWGPDSNRVVMSLLFVATMAGDLNWRIREENRDM